jgi:hypothetical protein
VELAFVGRAGEKPLGPVQAFRAGSAGRFKKEEENKNNNQAGLPWKTGRKERIGLRNLISEFKSRFLIQNKWV